MISRGMKRRSLLVLALISSAEHAHAEPPRGASPLRVEAPLDSSQARLEASRSASQPRLEASLGARVSKVGSAGYDPFASSDELLQASVGVGVTLFRQERLSLAGVGFWDFGSRSATARSADASLTVHRLSVGPELRFRVLQPMSLFVHVLPAFAHAQASLADGVAQSTRVAGHWSAGVDGALGAAFDLYTAPGASSIRPHLLVIAEAGYGYLGSTRLKLTPEAGQGAPERTAAVDLGSLSLAGPYLRISAAVSF